MEPRVLEHLTDILAIKTCIIIIIIIIIIIV